tara:strand:+ start:339 stop:7367 length:7029 start_codon:yes stop_codon:yes gene_type:complete
MPEIKHDFSAGKMNKDLDERIVPNGEYRDAMNIQVRTTDSSGGVGNAGTVQNIKGNKQIREHAHYETMYGDVGENESKIIASVSNEKNNTAYFFLSSPTFNTQYILQNINLITSSTSRKKFIDTIIEINTGSDTVAEPYAHPVAVDFWGIIDTADRVLTWNDDVAVGGIWQSFNVQEIDDYRVGMLVQAYDSNGDELFESGGAEIQDVQAGGMGSGKIILYTEQGEITWDNVAFFTFIHPKRVLNFSNTTKITGINIIDDLLFWTDNETEPKKINIKRFKDGSVQGTNLVTDDWTRHTQIKLKDPVDSDQLLDFTSDLEISLSPTVNNDLKKEHITVIRKAPLVAPTLEMNKTDRETQITTVPAFFHDFAILNEGTGPVPGEEVAISSFNNAANAAYILNDIDWRIGDIIKFKSPAGEWLTAGITSINTINCDEFDELGNVNTTDTDGDGTPNYLDSDCNDGEISLVVNILTIGSPLQPVEFLDNGEPASDQTGWWNITLQQRTPLFELKFGRFGLRYKYEDGEYSSFGPWSEIAFLPGHFDYDHKKGYNLGMTNQVRELIIKDFIPHQRVKPHDVSAIDILYKTTDSPSVYVVKTITRGKDSEWKLFTTSSPEAVSTDYMFGKLEITTEMIHKVLPENQLYRAWDNVPQKALAQEIAANRLVYSNYEQGYEIKVPLELEQIPLSDKTPTEIDPKKSIKSIRDYKFGLVFGDEYGRETPVIAPTLLVENEDNVSTIVDGGVRIDKISASSRNYFRLIQKWAQGNQAPDDWISYVKYYIKETSSEYYNLVMDRWYYAEDGNIWISFNSADRNKLDEDTYLILKNEHGSNKAVPEKARYKVIAIENEAPEFIKSDPRLMGEVTMMNTSESDASFAHMFTEISDNVENTIPPYLLMEEKEMYFIDTHFNGFLNDYTRNPKGELQVRVVGKLGEGQGASILRGAKWEKVTYIKKYNDDSDPDGAGRIRWANAFGEQANMFSRFTQITGESSLSNLVYYMEFREQVRVDKAEFDGKFFVKIEKDDILDNKVLLYSDAQNGWVNEIAMPIAYIDNQQYNPSETECTYCDPIDNPNDPTTTLSYMPRKEYKWFNGGADGGVTGQLGGLVSAGTPGDNAGLDVVTEITIWQNEDMCPSSWEEYDAGEEDGEFQGDQILPASTSDFNTATKSGCFSYDAQYLGLGCGDFDGIAGGTEYYSESRQAPTTESMNDIWMDVSVGDESYGVTNQSRNIINRAKETKEFWEWFSEKSLPDLEAQVFIDGARTRSVSYKRRWADAIWKNWVCDDGYDSDGNCQGPSDASWGEGEDGKYTGEYYKMTGIDSGVLYKEIDDDENNLEYGETNSELGRICFSVMRSSGSWYSSAFQYGWGEVGDDTYKFQQRMRETGTLFRFTSDPEKNIYQVIAGGQTERFFIWNYSEVEKEDDVDEWTPQWAGNTMQPCETPYDFSTVGIPGSDTGCCLNIPIQDVSYWLPEDPGFGDYSDNQYGAQQAQNRNFPFVWMNPGCPNVGRREEWNHLTFTNHNPFHHNPGSNSSVDDGFDEGEFADINNDQHIRVGGLYGHTFAIGGYLNQDRWDDDEAWRHAICKKCGSIYGNQNFQITNFNTGETEDWEGAPWEIGNGVSGFPKACLREGLRVEFRRYNIEALSLVGEGAERGTFGINTDIWDPRGAICHDGREAMRIEFVRRASMESEIVLPVSNAAIWETEPKENVGLDVYHEASNAIPIRLNSENTSNFAPYGSKVTLREWDGVNEAWTSVAMTNTDHHVSHIGYTQTHSIVGVKATNGDGDLVLQTDGLSIGDYMVFTHPDGTKTMTLIVSYMNPVNEDGITIVPSNITENLFQESVDGDGDPVKTGYYKLDSGVWKFPVELGWYNCWSYGNGVESNRIRDDFNAPKLDNGVKVSTTFLDYGRERRGSGMIYSGIYNSTAGVNDLNEFNMAEKITKDINPSYGSIQRIKTRDTDVVILTEDKVLKAVTNKDALYNADGNPQLLASNRVLGTAVPFVGDYGISNNPESLAWDQYRMYFTDMQRGSVLRLSRDGLTPVSEVGMKTWFRDNLKKTDSLLGTFDSINGEYNVTLNYKEAEKLKNKTVSFNERSKGWVSFKSFIPQAGESVGGKYLTAVSKDINSSGTSGKEKKGIFEHYVDITKTDASASNFGDTINRNVFYATDDSIQCEDSISGDCGGVSRVRSYFHDTTLTVMFNDAPGVVKSFKTLNYEGSQAKVHPFISTTPNFTDLAGNPLGNQNDGEYYNLIPKKGWWVGNIITDLSFKGTVIEFINKEGKWFNNIAGTKRTEMTDQDLNEFSVQGLGVGSILSEVSITENTSPTQVTININSDMIDNTLNPFDPLADNNQ